MRYASIVAVRQYWEGLLLAGKDIRFGDCG